jgi:hypothetical protein
MMRWYGKHASFHLDGRIVAIPMMEPRGEGGIGHDRGSHKA